MKKIYIMLFSLLLLFTSMVSETSASTSPLSIATNQGEVLKQKLVDIENLISSGDIYSIDSVYDQYSIEINKTEKLIGRVPGASKRKALNSKYITPAKIAKERVIYEVSQLRLLWKIEVLVEQNNLNEASLEIAKLDRLKRRAIEIKKAGKYEELPPTVNEELLSFESELKEVITKQTPDEETDPKDQNPDPDLSRFEVKGLEYQGRTTYKSHETSGEVKNIHHYSLTLPNSYPINIYVTDHYINQFGLGFAYGEIRDMMKSIEKHRANKPYQVESNTFALVFYKNSSNGTNDDHQFPLNVQAKSGSNGSYGDMDTVILMNGGTMPYDFRPTLTHELIHYYDQNAFHYIGYQSFGEEGHFWFKEGAAEYGCYIFYDYPVNHHNQLPLQVTSTDRDSIVTYAQQQGGYRKPLVNKDLLQKEFANLKIASQNNYGVALSFYWYLVNQYNEEKVRDFIAHIDQQPVMSKEKYNGEIEKCFGDSQQEILNGWMEEFPELF